MNEFSPWKSETAKHLNDIIIENCIDTYLTGSSHICEPPVLDTDIDILCHIKSLKDFCDVAEKEGFKTFESDAQHYDHHSGSFFTMRKGGINLIISESSDFIKRFNAATYVAKKLNLLKKEDRIMLFQAVLYGNENEGFV